MFLREMKVRIIWNDCKLENKEKYLRQVKEANVTIDECNRELQIITSEINRLKKEKEALQSVIKYMEVVNNQIVIRNRITKTKGIRNLLSHVIFIKLL